MPKLKLPWRTVEQPKWLNLEEYQNPLTGARLFSDARNRWRLYLHDAHVPDAPNCESAAIAMNLHNQLLAVAA